MHRPRVFGRTLRFHLLGTFALVFALASPASAQVEELLMEGAREDLGGGPLYYLLIEVEGTGLPSSATVTPPGGGGDITLTGFGGGFELEFTSAGFATFADLLVAYPTGVYSFDFDGEITTVTWAPTQLTSTGAEPILVVTSPADGATKQSSTPDVAYTLDCTNCDDLDLEIFDLDTDGSVADLTLTLLDQTPGSFPNPILFSSLTSSGSSNELPDGPNELEMLVGRVDAVTESFDGGSTEPDYTYLQATTLLDVNLFNVGPADSNFSVSEVLLEAALEDLGSGPVWNFFVEIEGQMLPFAATLDPPSGPQIPLTGDGTFLEYEDTGFATFAEVQTVYEAGSYLLTIGEETVTLDWDPTEPTGATGEPSLAVTEPADGSTITDTTPDVAFSFDCTNCNDLESDLFDVATDGNDASFGFVELDVMPAASFTNPIPFAQMDQEGLGTELPLGENEVELLIGLTDISTESFDAPTNLASFEYTAAATLIVINAFTVPEPGTASLSVVALLGVALVRARRGRGAGVLG